MIDLKTSPSQFSLKTRVLFLLLTCLAGIIVLFPELHFQHWLSTGDHGRDLDAFEQTLKGKIVYQDYWWVYGPLMPYYYALFYKMFGISIQSVLIGKFVIKLLGGIFCFAAVATLRKPLTAFMAALWFWTFQQDFFFTYNHIGGIAVEMAIIICLLLYIKNQRLASMWCAAGLCFILAMIKVNFGLSSLAVVLISTFMIDRSFQIPFSSHKKFFYFTSMVLIPSAIFFVYWLLLSPLPLYEIRQCLPYANADQPYNVMPWQAVWSFLNIQFQEIKNSPALLIFYFLSILCAAQTFLLYKNNTLNTSEKKSLKLIVLVLGLYALTGCHEFLKSGVWYRWFWAQPPLIVMVFVIFETAQRNMDRRIQWLLWTAVGSMIAIVAISSWQVAIQYQKPEQYIRTERGKIYVANPAEWVLTVNTTTDHLNTILKPDEPFFAVPYDVLYYFLTQRPSPSRQTIVFEHINVPPEQEQKMIQEIENQNVNYVLLSNRFMSPEKGLGIFGQTYCPILGKYFNDQFEATHRIGNWQQTPGWGWSHGTMILKRKSTLQNL